MAERIRLIATGSRIRVRLAADDRLVALVRRGDSAAFEAMYERHSGPLLSFCVYMLSSRHDAEDAIQATFTSAYRALRADDRPVILRPWLFTIARNECLTILRRRRPTVELNGEPALGGDPFRELEIREELRHMLDGLRELPERQRAALVLTEVHGLSQPEIGAVLGVRSEQVKAYVYQARSNLIADRRAREDDCREIREELAMARGAALLRGRLRRHVRSCSDCRMYADGVARQRRQIAALLPVAPSLMLRYRTLEDALGIGAADPATYAGGAAVGGSVAGLAGGGVKALAIKMAASMAVLGAGAGVGAAVIGVPISEEPAAAVSAAEQRAPVWLQASTGRAMTVAWNRSESGSSTGRAQFGIESLELDTSANRPSTLTTQSVTPAAGGGALDGGTGNPSGAGTTVPTGPEGAGPEHKRASREHPAKPAPTPKESEEERRKRRAEALLESEERQRTSEERQKKREQYRQLKGEEREARAQAPPPPTKEERRHAREELHAEGLSRPPETKQERQQAREERAQRRAEHREHRELR